MKNYNDFCLYCTGNKVGEIRECTDIVCPFYPFRLGGMEVEVEKDICRKILEEQGIY